MPLPSHGKLQALLDTSLISHVVHHRHASTHNWPRPGSTWAPVLHFVALLAVHVGSQTSVDTFDSESAKAFTDGAILSAYTVEVPQLHA